MIVVRLWEDSKELFFISVSSLYIVVDPLLLAIELDDSYQADEQDGPDDDGGAVTALARHEGGTVEQVHQALHVGDGGVGLLYHHVDQVVDLHSGHQTHNHDHEQGGRDHGQGDGEELLHLARAVDAVGLVEGFRDVLQSGQQEDGIVADVAPDSHDGFGHVVPGPVLVGVSHPGLVEHLPVIYQDDVVLVLGHAVDAPIGAAGVAQGDLGEVVLVVVGFHVVKEVGKVGQDAEVGVVQNLVGVHPEDVGHGVGLAGSLQLGPVLAPAGDLHLDVHVGMLGGVGGAHSLHAGSLVDIPNLKLEMGLAVGRAAPGQGQQQRSEQGYRRYAGNFFHNSTSFPLSCVARSSSNAVLLILIWK